MTEGSTFRPCDCIHKYAAPQSRCIPQASAEVRVSGKQAHSMETLLLFLLRRKPLTIKSRSWPQHANSQTYSRNGRFHRFHHAAALPSPRPRSSINFLRVVRLRRDRPIQPEETQPRKVDGEETDSHWPNDAVRKDGVVVI